MWAPRVSLGTAPKPLVGARPTPPHLPALRTPGEAGGRSQRRRRRRAHLLWASSQPGVLGACLMHGRQVERRKPPSPQGPSESHQHRSALPALWAAAEQDRALSEMGVCMALMGERVCRENVYIRTCTREGACVCARFPPKAVLHQPGPRWPADLCPAVGSSLAPHQPQGFGQWPLESEVLQPDVALNQLSRPISANGHLLHFAKKNCQFSQNSQWENFCPLGGWPSPGP